jgi:glycosyltransferase involved in cell wall biosynthesis
MKASIIVSTTTSQGKLLTCVNALCNQQFQNQQYEVIVTDISNFTKEDQTMLEQIKKDKPFLHILSPETNRARAINHAVKQAKGEILVFTESHCIPNKNWLQQITSHFKNKKIQAAQGTIISVSSAEIISKAENKLRENVYANQEKLKITSSYFDFHNSAILKSTWLNLNGLDEDLPITCEFDLGARMHQNNIPIHRDKKNPLQHLNDTRARTYAKLISAQGFEKTTILKKRGENFFNTYFPSPTLTKLAPAIKYLRIPLIALIIARLLALSAAISLMQALNKENLGIRAFSTFAKDAHRYGMLKGLARIKKAEPK